MPSSLFGDVFRLSEAQLSKVQFDFWFFIVIEYKNMATITIPKNLIKNDDLVVIPRQKYKEFLNLEKIIERKIVEEADLDLAIKIYKKEKCQGKLKTIKSLVDLDWVWLFAFLLNLRNLIKNCRKA